MKRYVSLESLADGTDTELGRFTVGNYGFLFAHTAEGEFAMLACMFDGPSPFKIVRTQVIREHRLTEFRMLVSEVIAKHEALL